MADAFGCDVVHFPVPAFFDFASTKEAMWRERMVTRVLGLQSRLDLVIFGVGALEGPLQSHVYASGYLDEEDTQQVIDEHVVGDICTVLLRVGTAPARHPVERPRQRHHAGPVAVDPSADLRGFRPSEGAAAARRVAGQGCYRSCRGRIDCPHCSRADVKTTGRPEWDRRLRCGEGSVVRGLDS